jgi:hypothetical protein
MKAIYFDAGNGKAVAMIPKVGTSTLARAIIRDRYPEIEDLLQNRTHYPAGGGPDNLRLQGMCPKAASLDGKTLLVPVRDPVERFRSACAQMGWGSRVEAVLDELENPMDGSKPTERADANPHFCGQTMFADARLAAAVKLYRFPDHLEVLAAEAGLALPLPTINDANGTKPDLTPAQLARVEAIYADDIALFADIETAGQTCAATEPQMPEPGPQQSYEAALAAGHEVNGVTYGIAEKDQIAWTAALTALDNASALGAFDPSVTPVEAVLGPILDIAGCPVPSMTVIVFRQTMLALVQRIGHIRAQYAGGVS